jgi:hypothetical protein
MPGVYRRPPAIITSLLARPVVWRQPGGGAQVQLPALIGLATQGLSTLYSGSGQWLGSNPATALQIGDTILYGNATGPGGGAAVTVYDDGRYSYNSGGSNARSSFQWYVFRRITGQIDGPGTVWINEVAPIWLQGLVGAVGTVGTPFGASFNTSYVFSPFGDPLTFAIVSGALPPGLTMDSAGNITGTPTLPGIFNFTVSATDITGTASVSPANSFTVGQFINLGPTDNIRVRTPRLRSRTLRTGARPQVPDWQSLSKMEADKVRRIDRKLRELRNAPPAEREQALEDELHVELPASAAYHPAPMAVGHVPHTDDQDIARILEGEHRQLMSLAAHTLKVLGS